MMMLSLLFVVAMSVGIYFYIHQRKALPGNRYRNIKEDVLGLDNIEKKSTVIEPTLRAPAKSDHSQPDCVVVLYLMAPKGSVYAGYELLQALLSAGMRYGKQNIFHRHTHKDGRGEILFHCASAVAPGTFDLTKIGTFSCQGLCLFFKANTVDEPLTTFDCLLETIDQLVEDIGGDVLDEKRERFTKERMMKYRQQIRALENGKVTADLFAD